jgi:hypothetical protein
MKKEVLFISLKMIEIFLLVYLPYQTGKIALCFPNYLKAMGFIDTPKEYAYYYNSRCNRYIRLWLIGFISIFVALMFCSLITVSIYGLVRLNISFVNKIL